jgi:hypothetical protein
MTTWSKSKLTTSGIVRGRVLFEEKWALVGDMMVKGCCFVELVAAEFNERQVIAVFGCSMHWLDGMAISASSGWL